MEKVVVKPLGQVLKQAGLISEEQIRTALEIQGQGEGVKFGQILVQQGILTPTTVDFFAEIWPQLWQQPRTKPLGYYLHAAALLDRQQINTLRSAQKQTGKLCGELAVEKGWLRAKTLNFFRQHVGITQKKAKWCSPDQQVKNEPLTRIAAALSLLGLLILFPLVIVFNNSSSQRASENSSLDSGALSRSGWCVEPRLTEETIQEDWLLGLEQEQQRLAEQFPANCQRNLDRLRVLKAIQLGRNNRVLEGIEYLCQISPTSASFNQAQMWLSRWYTNAHWGEPTQSYLPSMSDCPVAQWNLKDYEWATHYQQARDYLERSDYPPAWESLELAAEQAISDGQPTLLLAELLKQEQGIWQSVAREKAQQWQLLKELLLKAELSYKR